MIEKTQGAVASNVPMSTAKYFNLFAFVLRSTILDCSRAGFRLRRYTVGLRLVSGGFEIGTSGMKTGRGPVGLIVDDLSEAIEFRVLCAEECADRRRRCEVRIPSLSARKNSLRLPWLVVSSILVAAKRGAAGK